MPISDVLPYSLPKVHASTYISRSFVIVHHMYLTTFHLTFSGLHASFFFFSSLYSKNTLNNYANEDLCLKSHTNCFSDCPAKFWLNFICYYYAMLVIYTMLSVHYIIVDQCTSVLLLVLFVNFSSFKRSAWQPCLWRWPAVSYCKRFVDQRPSPAWLVAMPVVREGPIPSVCVAWSGGYRGCFALHDGST